MGGVDQQVALFLIPGNKSLHLMAPTSSTQGFQSYWIVCVCLKLIDWKEHGREHAESFQVGLENGIYHF